MRLSKTLSASGKQNWQNDKGLSGLSPGQSSYHFDIGDKNVDLGPQSTVQTIPPEESQPLLLYKSAAARVFMRVAVANAEGGDNDFNTFNNGSLMWSQSLHVSSDTVP